VDGEQKVLQLQKKSQELESKLATYTGFIFYVLLLLLFGDVFRRRSSRILRHRTLPVRTRCAQLLVSFYYLLICTKVTKIRQIFQSGILVPIETILITLRKS
jgi:hypothetical protein